MAAGVMTNFLIQAPTPAYFPLIFQNSPCKEDEEEMQEKPELRDEEEEKEVDEEDDDEEDESEAQEEDQEGLEEVFLSPAHCTLDVTKQLLRFADLISRDVQRYFGRCTGDQETCDIYNDSVSETASGRLRYYDDLLKIARAGSPEEQENSFVTYGADREVGSLGPLAELFDHRGQSQGRGRPMIKRHLPLSFWTEPAACCSPVSLNTSNTTSDTSLQDRAHSENSTNIHYNLLQHNTNTLDSTQPDFSDLLANWDPNPELTNTLTESSLMQQ